MKNGTYEERFGLKTALSVIDPENLRKIDKKNMSVSPKNTSEQLTKTGVISDFGIDIEQDLIQSITGKSIDKNNFGEIVSGKDSLNVSISVNCNSIKQFLKLCHEKYVSNEYKKSFSWIDHIAEIKDLELIKSLNNKLIDKLRDNDENRIWMAVPEVIKWETVVGFKYKKSDSLKNDIEINSFLDSLTDKENLNKDFLTRKMVSCIGSENDTDLYKWSAYNCIYCEIEEENKLYLLSNGKWYKTEKNFVNKVNTIFRALRDEPSIISLPKYNHENEARYNEEISKRNRHFCCMDRKIIQHGGGHGKIEFCDIMTTDKKIIHIKRYGNSSVLSHLFNQGLVSGELFLRDEEFRNKINKKLDIDFKISNIDQKPDASQYTIIFGIISLSKNSLEIPFFSKVALRTATERLKAFGYRVHFIKIDSKHE